VSNRQKAGKECKVALESNSEPQKWGILAVSITNRKKRDTGYICSKIGILSMPYNTGAISKIEIEDNAYSTCSRSWRF
jgi:hypothetical protein